MMTLFSATTTPAPITLEALAAEVQSAIAGVLALDPEQAAIRAGLSFLVVGGAALLVALIRFIFRALLARIAPREPNEGKDRAHRAVGGMTLSLTRIGVTIGAIYLLLRVWGVDFGELRSGAFAAVFANIARALLIIVIAVGATELSGFAILRVLGRVARSASDPRRAAQVRTLAPVLKGAAQTIIVVLAGMMFLSQIGVEVGPLVAGAGIVGLAVGFGAQTIVKDFLTGIFLIIEDIVSIGDVVTIQNFSGRVEEMTLRTIRLRDFDGTLHVFPYGEAQVIHNQTKSFSYFAFQFQISYLSDIDAAIAALERVGESLALEEEYAQLLLGKVEIAGLDSLSDNGMIIKGRIKTEPGEQGKIGSAFYTRAKRELDAAGVLIEHRHLPVPPFDSIAARANR